MNRAEFLAYVATLIRAEIFSHPVSNFDVCESHTGFVLLTGTYAYKFRKPIAIPFGLDYSTPELRFENLTKEIALNRVFDHEIYQRVIPIYRAPDGRLRSDEPGALVDAMLQMHELPQSALLTNYFAAGHQLSPVELRRLAETLTTFHAECAVVDVDALDGLQYEYEWVLHNIPSQVDAHARQQQLDHIALLPRARDLFRSRTHQGFVRDAHGDFRADNCFYWREKFYPFDRIEYKDSFRRRDVANDLASMAVDCWYYGHSDWLPPLVAVYAEHAIGRDVAKMLPFYLQFRALLMTAMCHDLSRGQSGAEAAQNQARSLRYWNVACEIIRTYPIRPETLKA